MIDTQQAMSRLINVDPEIMSGTPVFMGTRVPVETLFDHLEYGYDLDGFIEQFPSVMREQAAAVLELSKDLLISRAR